MIKNSNDKKKTAMTASSNGSIAQHCSSYVVFILAFMHITYCNVVVHA